MRALHNWPDDRRIHTITQYGLLANIDLHNHPGLAALLMEGETLEEFMKLSPEQILIRWVNYHLARSNCGRQIANFTSDIKDSVAYVHLLHQISPPDSGITTSAEHVRRDFHSDNFSFIYLARIMHQ